jgi:hypothetical protein
VLSSSGVFSFSAFKQMGSKVKANGSTVLHTRILACSLLLAVPAAFAADGIRTERVHFHKGTTSALIEARIQGVETVDYVVGARAGQHMNVSLATRHTATYFNIMAPGENQVAMFNGSMRRNQYEGTLPASGDYKIRVYMMRSAARRNEVSHYRLELIVDGAGRPAAHASNRDAKVAATDFHAVGHILCSMRKGQPTSACAFGVEREGNGTAVVTVTRLEGRKQLIFFENGRAVGYDQS